MSCPFCPIEKKTDWFAESPDGIVVCEDLNARGYKYRLLIVGSGRYFHRSYSSFSENEIKRFVRMGERIARRHIKEGRASKIIKIDFDHLVIKNHYHIQICMG